MKLTFKISALPPIQHEVKDYPIIGTRLDLPYPIGGFKPVMITRINFSTKIENSTFFGEWV